MRNGEENEGDSPVISEKKEEEKEEDGDSVEINEEEEERKYYRGNMVGQLQEYLMGRGLGVATYADGEITGPAHKLHFTMRASLGNVVQMGEGSTKKEAKVNTSPVALSVQFNVSTKLLEHSWTRSDDNPTHMLSLQRPVRKKWTV